MSATRLPSITGFKTLAVQGPDPDGDFEFIVEDRDGDMESMFFLSPASAKTLRKALKVGKA